MGFGLETIVTLSLMYLGVHSDIIIEYLKGLKGCNIKDGNDNFVENEAGVIMGKIGGGKAGREIKPELMDALKQRVGDTEK